MGEAEYPASPLLYAPKRTSHSELITVSTKYTANPLSCITPANPAQTRKGIYVENAGTGRAGHFRITNAANNSTSVAASTVGGGGALSGYTTGTGSAGLFEVNNVDSEAPALVAITNSSSIDGSAGQFTVNNASSWAHAISAESNGQIYAAYIRGTTADTEGLYIATEGATGLMVTGGTKSAAVPTSRGMSALYCEEATEVWFADYGFGRLSGGIAFVGIDPIFAETVSIDEPYHVFVQPYGDAELFVAGRNRDGFEVRARDGGSDVEFSYRIVAKRRGHEDKRLETVEIPE